jgi:CubicO group peptidase (beta-lactamase class C family)
VTFGFENSAVYQDAGDAFEAAQHSIVAAVPGAVYRYINSGLNVLGAIVRDQIERRGLPYHETLYGLLIDRLGMTSYQHSADIAGNLIASGAGFATLRDYAKLGVLYLQNGMWDGDQLLPQGWADYALTATHTGTSYAACFRTNIDRLFPDLPLITGSPGSWARRIFPIYKKGEADSFAAFPGASGGKYSRPRSWQRRAGEEGPIPRPGIVPPHGGGSAPTST